MKSPMQKVHPQQLLTHEITKIGQLVEHTTKMIMTPYLPLRPSQVEGSFSRTCGTHSWMLIALGKQIVARLGIRADGSVRTNGNWRITLRVIRLNMREQSFRHLCRISVAHLSNLFEALLHVRDAQFNFNVPE
jgi:hypothetical protein